jgi:hypothetical protein
VYTPHYVTETQSEASDCAGLPHMGRALHSPSEQVVPTEKCGPSGPLPSPAQSDPPCGTLLHATFAKRTASLQHPSVHVAPSGTISGLDSLAASRLPVQ